MEVRENDVLEVILTEPQLDQPMGDPPSKIEDQALARKFEQHGRSHALRFELAGPGTEQEDPIAHPNEYSEGSGANLRPKTALAAHTISL